MEALPRDGILRAGSFAELSKTVEADVLQLGFRYFSYLGRFPRSRIGDDVHFDNCPEGWRSYCRKHHAAAGGLSIDSDGLEAVTPMLWRERAAAAPALFAEAHKYGLITGSTHPVHGPDGQWSALSFIKDRGGAQAEADIEGVLAQCHLLASYVHAAAARLVRGALDGANVTPSRTHSAQGRLNERERQVLSWAAAGKSMAAISDLLAISERTVLFHLSNVRRKLGAANSRHAIGKALTLGLIRVPPGFPPPLANGGGTSRRRS